MVLYFYNISSALFCKTFLNPNYINSNCIFTIYSLSTVFLTFVSRTKQKTT